MDEIKYGVAWLDSFELGCEKVDTQHRELLLLLDKLIHMCMDGSSTAKLHETLDFLANYTIQHFRDEEALQIKYGFPDYPRHKALHDDFKVTVSELVRKFDEAGSTEQLSSDVNKIVVRWVIGHINSEDTKIGKHIRSVTGQQ